LSTVTTLLPFKNQTGDGARPARRFGVGSKILKQLIPSPAWHLVMNRLADFRFAGFGVDPPYNF
jgi:hypothetical protein